MDHPSSELLITASPPVWFEGFATPALIAPDGRQAIVGSSASGDLRIIDLDSGHDAMDRLRSGLDAVAGAVFGPQGRPVLLGTARGERSWFLHDPLGPRPLALPADAVPQWSSDGERIAFYLRQAPERGFTVINGDDEWIVPIDGRISALGWAPDGRSVLVLAANTAGMGSIYRIGRSRVVECLVGDLDATMYGRPAPLAISPDGRRVYLALASPGAPDPTVRHQPRTHRDLDIYEVNLATGTRRAVVATAADEFGPAVAGRHLYWSVSSVEQSVVIVPREGGAIRVVVGDAQLPTWRPDGRMLGYTFGHWRQADWVLNWDGGVVEVDADARAVGVPRAYITGYHEDFSPVWSPDGHWIAYHSHRSAEPVAYYSAGGSSDDIYLCREGSAQEIRLTTFGHEVGSPSWSPEGNRLVFTGWLNGTGRSGVWITTINPESGQALSHRRLELPASIGGASDAAWCPVGEVIALVAPVAHGRRALWTIRPDGAVIRKIAEYPMLTYGGVDWTPDGRTLVFPAIVSGRMQLFTISSEGGEPQRLTDEDANILQPKVSPNGRWIAATRIRHTRELRRMSLGENYL